jgi:hypothetical protein
VPGLFLAQHAGGGKAEQIFLRGYDIDHGTDLNVSVDGMPVNMVSHAHGQGYADMHFIIPELVQNIEYGKGPYTTEVGNFATAGYAKLNTTDVLEKSKITIEAGQFNTLRNVNMIDLLKSSQKGLNKSAYIASEIYTTNGPFKSSQDFNRINLQSKYTFQTENSKLTIQGTYFSSKWNASGQIPERAVINGSISRWGAIDSTEGGNTGRQNLAVTYLYKPSALSVIENSFFATRYTFRLYSNFTFFLNDSANGDQIKQEESRTLIGYNGSIGASKQINKLIWKHKHGISILYDGIENSMLAHTVQRKFLRFTSFGDINEYNNAAYSDHQFIFGKFNFNIGLRLDQMRWEYTNHLDSLYKPFTAQKTILSPKLNLQYNFSSKLQFYLKSGKGFHSNDARTISQQKGRGMLPAVYGTDLGCNAKIHKKLWLNTALWQLFSEQEFVYVGDEGIVEASGRSQRIGMDASVRFQITKNIFSDFDFTYTSPKALDVSKSEAYIPLAPLLTFTGGLSFKFKNGFNGNVRFRHLADRPADETNTIIAKGYTIFDAGMFYTKSKFEIGIIIQNIFNAKWKEAQFATTSKLTNEKEYVTEIHYTPGTPFLAKLKMSYFF